MAVDMFLKLDGIDGEVQDHMHSKEIEVLAWSWGASQGAAQSATAAMGAGPGGCKASIHDLYFTKYIDRSTNSLMQKIFSGGDIASGTLVVRSVGANPLEYLKIIMTNIRVKSLSTGGSTGDDRLSENVALSFKKVDIEYVPQGQDGKRGSAMTASWDSARNIPTENISTETAMRMK